MIDFADKGAADIVKYKHFGEEGYGYIYVQNGTDYATFNEKCVFSTFKGIEQLKP